METCASCGTALGAGRFCTHCGQRVDAPAAPAGGGPEQTAVLELDDWRTGTAERPAVPGAAAPRGVGAVPPPLPPVPSYDPAGVDAPRFPLFADQVEPGTLAPPPPDRGRPAWLPWAVGGAVLLLVAVLGGVLLGGGDDDPQAKDTAPSSTDGSTQSRPKGKPTPSHSAAPGESGDVARYATVQVPATAPPNQDVSGNMVRYEGRNMLDGVADTCWRMTGDGTGREITVTLDGPTTLTQVGMINGYAKSAVGAGGGTLDWYHGNRRIMAVEWSFDDGSSYSQTFEDTKAMQTIDIDPVTTRTVTIRLVSVSAPGTGRAARNNTAISDLTLVGTPA
ncbi:hypothetical protein FB382_002232 [Nocardioides ginsengisegetis]|uniref:NAD glycohydrolase translocation F5/8 type C domain-containing protein n=1 Tax=Nocardioides ginsengisegetis TaxID=661491 RepID=A0A7W3J0D2_9ACTN|nr:hypothetical protein [Nocardioides ginsengisegetis]MBA8803941.1 hypothetical protein [Nocardioides ginsengisegetis]